MNDSTPVLEAAIDWLTVSCHGRDRTDALSTIANNLVGAEVDAGADVAPFDLLGYVGWRAGRVRYGERDSAGLLQLSGAPAEVQADALLPIASRVPRIDFALTLRPPVTSPTYGERYWTEYAAYHSAHPTSALPWQVRDAEGGCTVYLGSRRGDAFARLYDKGRESCTEGDDDQTRRYDGAWRHEIEYHDDAAWRVARAALGSANRAQWIAGHIAQWVTAHGGSPDWPLDTTPALVGGFRRRSDRDSRLRWFRTQVAPGVRRELERGNQTEVFRALGLLPGEGLDNCIAVPYSDE